MLNNVDSNGDPLVIVITGDNNYIEDNEQTGTPQTFNVYGSNNKFIGNKAGACPAPPRRVWLGACARCRAAGTQC